MAARAALADEIGADRDRFFADMKSEEVARELESSAAIACVFGFIGTPAMVIGRTVVQGQIPRETVLRIAEQERQEDWRSAC